MSGRLTSDALRKTTALTLIVVVALPATIVPGEASASHRAVQQRAASGESVVAAPTVEALDAARLRLGRLLASSGRKETTTPADSARRLRDLFGLAQAAHNRMPRDTFDIEAVAKPLRGDVSGAHRWVRDHTTWAPYHGVLRGAEGVLMDRVGNTLDRALLLSGLLRANGITTRLAHTLLTDDQASAVLAGLASAPKRTATRGWALTESGRPDAEQYAVRAGLDVEALRRGWQEVDRLAADAEAAFRSRVEAQTSGIIRSLGLSQVDAANATATDPRDMARDHWWVQWQHGTVWRDLDPTQAAIDVALTPARDISDPGRLSPELYHRVTISAVIERLENGVLTTARPLTHTVRAVDTFGKQITLRHTALSWPRDLVVESGRDGGARLSAAVLEQREWLPILSIEGRHVAQASFTDTGAVNAKPGSQVVTTGPKPTEGLVDALSGETAPGSADGVLTAEWIEYEVISPGQEPRQIRREIFDLLGPGARASGHGAPALNDTLRETRGLSLLGETEILVLSCDWSPEYVEHLTSSRMLANQAAVETLATVENLPSRAFQERFERLVPLPSRLFEGAWGTRTCRRSCVSAHNLDQLVIAAPAPTGLPHSGIRHPRDRAKRVSRAAREAVGSINANHCETRHVLSSILSVALTPW